MNYLPFTRPSIDEATIAQVDATLRSGWLASGPRVVEFEAALGTYFSGRPVRVLTSATAGLEIALRALGVGPGHEVIAPAMTFVATANVIARVGARPVLVDVDLATRNMNMALVEAAITPATKAIMPVHFAGLPVDMEALHDLARTYRLRVIEDAAHAIGASAAGQRIGAIGDVVCFSFHPNKNMTTLEGGALVCDDPEELRQIERHRFHGIVKAADGAMDVDFPGGKANLTDVAATVGLGQLRQLDAFNRRRTELAEQYFDLLGGDERLNLPPRGVEGHCWHLFAPLLDLARLSITRQRFIALMHERGIGVGVHYPALHLFSHYRTLGYSDGDFPAAERIGSSTVTLPLFPAMDDADVVRVCAALTEILDGHRQ